MIFILGLGEKLFLLIVKMELFIMEFVCGDMDCIEGNRMNEVFKLFFILMVVYFLLFICIEILCG